MLPAKWKLITIMKMKAKLKESDTGAGGDPKTATTMAPKMGHSITFSDGELQKYMRRHLRFVATALGKSTGPVPKGFLTVEQLLLKYGKGWTPAALPPGVARGLRHQCFENACYLAHERPALTYVEGYGFKSRIPVPILHAWCVDRAGRVVDITWNEPDKSCYFGIPFKTSFLRFFLIQEKHYGILDSPYAPIQQGVWPVKKWLSLR
jgi:hypothetical protein